MTSNWPFHLHAQPFVVVFDESISHRHYKHFSLFTHVYIIITLEVQNIIIGVLLINHHLK